MAYFCATCGKEHNDLPDIGAKAPVYWSAKFAADPNSLLTSDLCIIEGTDYFVRGVLEIPIRGEDRAFGWGVWVSHSRENFETYRANPDSADIGPFYGWLSTRIDYFPISTLSLKAMAQYRGLHLRPRIILQETDHPLSVQQREGISLAEAWRIVHHYMPPSEAPN